MKDLDLGEFSGGCQCGAVRFHAQAIRENPHVCYCRMCQKAMGNLFAALVGVGHENLTWTRGKPTEFNSSEHVGRGFCSNCGTPLYYRHHGGPHISFTIGSFDEPHCIPLLYQMGLEGKHPSLFRLNEVEEAGTTESAMGDDAVAIKRSNNQHPDHDTTDWTPRKSTAL